MSRGKVNVFIALLAACLCCVFDLSAQKQAPPPRPSQASDTSRYVEIINANTYRFLTIDSVKQIQVMTGNVQLLQGNTRFRADSVVFNERENFVEAFGNIHIKDADSVNIYSQYLMYEGTKKLATFKRNVKLSDGNSILYTDHMEYDLNGKVGTYRDGGRLESKQTTLTSKQGFYYADIKDVYFYEKVKLADPEYALATDTLLYNTGNRVATFLAPTTIKTGNSIVYTKEGFYDLQKKQSRLGKRSVVQDSSSVMIADDFAFDDNKGMGEARGNVWYKDSVQKMQLYANTLYFHKKKKSFLATDKPVLVLVQETDSIYIAADTLFSGMFQELKTLRRKGFVSAFDTSKVAFQEADSSVVINRSDLLSISNPLKNKPEKTSLSKDTIQIDSIASSTKNTISVDTIRFITGFRNVRIYNDSLQAVADSMFYSGIDSSFALYYEPTVWNKDNQITGDTILLFTKNKKADKMDVFENAMMIQQLNSECYNQLRGRFLKAIFKDGEISFTEVKGNSESIYFARDSDSAFIGMTRTEADKIDMMFKNKQLQQVKYIRSIKSTTYPMRSIPEGKAKLEGFEWRNEKRPKDKFSLFQ